MAFKTSFLALTAAIPLALAATQTVIVGPDNTLTYEPANIQAAVGDIIMFQFATKNHTATRSTFANPCQAMAEGGFGSGFRPVAEAEPASLEFSITVNDTEPIWGYCAQGNHCVSGMVFSINAPTTGDETFEAFQAAAVALAPPAASGSASGTPSGSQSGTPSGSQSGSANPSGTPEPTDDDGAASSLVARTGVVAALAFVVSSLVAL